MVSIHLQPPEKFDFMKPGDWPWWRRCFKQYRSASGLSEESEVQQVSTLLYCLSEEAEDVLMSTNIAAEDRVKYGPVLKKLNECFKVRKNVIFERARFNGRNQLQGESAEQNITILYNMVESCEYAGLKVYATNSL